MRTRIQNPYSLKVGNFLKFKAKNIIIKRPLVEQFALNQNHIRNIQANNSLYRRWAIARPGYFLGVSTYRDFIHRSNRLIKKKRYYVSKLVRRKKMRAKLLYKIKKVEKKKKQRGFNIRYARIKLKRAYYTMKKNVQLFYKKTALRYKLHEALIIKKERRFFKIKREAYKKRLKKEIKKTFFLFKGKRKYYYPRDFYLKKGKRKWEFPEKHFIKKGKRIYYVDKIKVRRDKKHMLLFKKKIKKKAFNRRLKPRLRNKKALLIRRLQKKYIRVKLKEEAKKNTPQKYRLMRPRYRYIKKKKKASLPKKKKKVLLSKKRINFLKSRIIVNLWCLLRAKKKKNYKKGF